MGWPINNEEAHKFTGLCKMTREIFTDRDLRLSAVSIHGEPGIDILWPYHYCQDVILICYPRVYLQYLHTLAQIYMNMPRLNFKQITIRGAGSARLLLTVCTSQYLVIISWWYPLSSWLMTTVTMSVSRSCSHHLLSPGAGWVTAHCHYHLSSPHAN